MKHQADDGRMVPLTADDVQRFRRCAPAALRRRGSGFMAQEIGGAVELVLTGLPPIIGMIWFDWSATQLLVFLLVGTWVSIACDIARFVCLTEAAESSVRIRFDDWHVWVVAEALRKDRRLVPADHLKAKYSPKAGILVDLTFGTVGTSVIGVMMAGGGATVGELFQNMGLFATVVGLVMYQVLLAIWEIVAHRLRPDNQRPVRLVLGPRGVGLFLLMFLVVFLSGDGPLNSPTIRWVMLIANGVILLYAVACLAGLWMVQSDTVWLRDYLEREPGDA